MALLGLWHVFCSLRSGPGWSPPARAQSIVGAIMRNLLVTGTFAALLLAGTVARAEIIFQTGNHPQANETNILFEASETDTTLDNGEVGHSGAGVTFDSLTGQHLTQQAKGQADIFCFSS